MRRVCLSRRSSPSARTTTGFAVSILDLAADVACQSRARKTSPNGVSQPPVFVCGAAHSNGTAERLARGVSAAFSLSGRLCARVGQCGTRTILECTHDDKYPPRLSLTRADTVWVWTGVHPSWHINGPLVVSQLRCWALRWTAHTDRFIRCGALCNRHFLAARAQLYSPTRIRTSTCSLLLPSVSGPNSAACRSDLPPPVCVCVRACVCVCVCVCVCLLPLIAARSHGKGLVYARQMTEVSE
jgi:hypothetical protein